MSKILSNEIKALDKEFSKLAQRHGTDKVFIDFLEFVIHLWRADTEEAKEFSGYTKEEAEQFYQTWVVFANEMHRLINAYGCYDILGDYYEYIASSSRKSSFGQYFTPMNVVKMMVQMVAPKEEGKVLDPSCGAGRMLIASQVDDTSIFTYGIDLDRTCCLMTVVNMLLHGCRGEVVRKDALDFRDYYEGWAINTDLWEIGIPSVRKLEKENSYIWGFYEGKKKEHQAKQEEQQRQIELKKFKKAKFQTSIF